MRISELLSGESSPVASPLRRIERLVSEIEKGSRTINSESLEELQECVLGLSSSVTDVGFSEEEKVQVWKLSYRLWNVSVDAANQGRMDAEAHARLRQVASDMLLSVRSVASVRFSLVNMATLLYRTGATWFKIRNYKSAGTCFEKATELLSSSGSTQSKEEQQLTFDLCLARSQVAWELSQKALASSLLGRAREHLSDSVDRYQEVANVCLRYGKSLLAHEDPESKAESLKYIEQAYEICCQASKTSACKDSSEEQALTSQKLNILRFIAACQLQNGNFEGVLKCVALLKNTSYHGATSVLAIKALVFLGRHDEAEKELLLLVSHEKATAHACMAALGFMIQETQSLDAVKKAFFASNSRFSSNCEMSSFVVENLLKKASPSDPLSRKRVEVALSIATDDRVVKRVTSSAPGLRMAVNSSLHCRKELYSIHTLLWNSGSDFFQAKDYSTSVRLFEASMLYLPPDEEAALRAKALRVLCLCHLGLLQYDRAAEYVDAAEKIEPNVACCFLKFKICLLLNDEAGAVSQVSRMLNCSDFEPEFLTLASHEAVTCKSTKVAVSALSNMLPSVPTSGPASTKEVTIIRNLIFLAMQDPKCQEEAVKYLNLAQSRLGEIGADRFLGSGNNGQREASWFAGCAWNQGLEAAKSQDWKRCSELFACASDFYALHPDAGENLQCLETSLLLTVAAILAHAKETDSEQLNLASVYLERCRKVHTAMLKKSQASTTTDFYLNLLAFDLKGRQKEYKEQLEIMYRCASMPGFKPEHLFSMAMHASNGSNTEVPLAALRSCLNLLLSSPAPDYKRAAIIMRKLIQLSDQRNKDGADVLQLYNEATRILLGLKNDTYPPEEVQWLVSTAWNRAALQVKLSRFVSAEAWMRVALELLNYAPGMESCRPTMMENLNEVLSQCHSGVMEE